MKKQYEKPALEARGELGKLTAQQNGGIVVVSPVTREPPSGDPI